MMIGIIVIIVGGVLLHKNKENISSDVRKRLEKMYQDPVPNMKNINFLQETVKCCGANDFGKYPLENGFEFLINQILIAS